MTGALVSFPSHSTRSSGCASPPRRQNPLQSMTASSVLLRENTTECLKKSEGLTLEAGIQIVLNEIAKRRGATMRRLSPCSTRTARKASRGISHHSNFFMPLSHYFMSLEIALHSIPETPSEQVITTPENNKTPLLSLQLCFLCKVSIFIIETNGFRK